MQPYRAQSIVRSADRSWRRATFAPFCHLIVAVASRDVGGREGGSNGNSGGADGGGDPVRAQAAHARPRTLSAGADAGAAIPLQSLLHRVREDPVSSIPAQEEPLGGGVRPRLRRVRGP